MLREPLQFIPNIQTFSTKRRKALFLIVEAHLYRLLKNRYLDLLRHFEETETKRANRKINTDKSFGIAPNIRVQKAAIFIAVMRLFHFCSKAFI